MIGLAAILVFIVAFIIAKSGFSQAAKLRKDAELESFLHPYWLRFFFYSALLAAIPFLSTMLFFAGRKGLYVLELMAIVLLVSFLLQGIALFLVSVFAEKLAFTRAALKAGTLFVVLYVPMFFGPLCKILNISTHN